jgi:4-amino-4-deoxy-L-arabinose transferase-like glycosyltransferase
MDVVATGCRSRLILLVLLAGLFTGLNSLKPLQVDDAAYYYFAAHIAEHPLDPYGFTIDWYQWPEPANYVLAPPGLLYWWAAGIRLFGPHPVLWKLWLMPISCLFVGSLYSLFRRFVRGLEMPLVWMTVLSPAFLPSLNLMLDVPALALSLFALTLFLRAGDRLDPVWLLGAGLAAGIAMETKYTAFLAPATMLLYAGIQSLLAPGDWKRRLGILSFALIATLIALNVFWWWEVFIAWRHGESHFYHEFQNSQRDWAQQLAFFSLPLFALLGGVASTLVLLGLVALRRHAWQVGLAGAVLLLGYALVACCGATVLLEAAEGPIALQELGTDAVTVEQMIFWVFGFGVALTLVLVALRLLRVCRGSLWRRANWRRYRIGWFLVLWLALELGGYFALTPFGAVRRILGVVVVAAILISRQAALTARTPQRRWLVWAVALVTSLLGLGFYGVDYRDAWAEREGARQAAALIRAREPQAVIWYIGHWGFQFYAEASGMRPVIPDWPAYRLHQGDWLVVPSPPVEQQRLQIDPQDLELVEEWSVRDFVPLRTVRCFYGTATGVPLEQQEGPRLTVQMYRARRDFVPRTPPP